MKKLGIRMKLYHINDMRIRVSGSSMTLILKLDNMELGYGNMDFGSLLEQARFLKNYINWADHPPIKSLQMSAKFLNSLIA